MTKQWIKRRNERINIVEKRLTCKRWNDIPFRIIRKEIKRVDFSKPKTYTIKLDGLNKKKLRIKGRMGERIIKWENS